MILVLYAIVCLLNLLIGSQLMLKTFPFIILLVSAFAANADVPLTKADLLGSWRIETEALSADGKDAKELNSVWTFREDGTMEGLSSDTNAHARVSEFRATLNWSIVDGKIQKQVSPGRSRMQDCVAIEKNGPKMVLDCNHIYFRMLKVK